MDSTSSAACLARFSALATNFVQESSRAPGVNCIVFSFSKRSAGIASASASCPSPAARRLATALWSTSALEAASATLFSGGGGRDGQARGATGVTGG
eukprot:4271342-Karenia_brevis.AAC.1